MLMQLSELQWNVLLTVFVVGIGAMVASSYYLVSSQTRILFKYRNAVVLAGAASLNGAFFLSVVSVNFLGSSDGSIVTEGLVNGSYSVVYRLAMYVIGSPLILIAVLRVLDLENSTRRRLFLGLLAGEILMTSLGAMTQLVADLPGKIIFGTSSVLIAVLVLYVLTSRLTEASHQVQGSISRALGRLRAGLIACWTIIPVGYAFRLLEPGLMSLGDAFFWSQLVLCAGDVILAVALPLLITRVSVARSVAEGVPS